MSLNAKSRRWLAALAAAALGSLCGFALQSSHWLQLIELKAYDLHMLRLPERIPPDVFLVVIDQKSIEEYPEPIFLWHQYYARAIEAAARQGAKVIGVDIAFGIPVRQWAPGHDEALASAFLSATRNARVVCGTASPLTTRQREWPVPWNMLCAAGGAAAYVNLRADEDDFIRSVEVEERQSGTPSFAFAVARAFRPGLPKPAEPAVRIRHAGPAGTIRRVSLAEFLSAAERGDDRRLQGWVKGKAVLLGPDLLTDRHATPFYAFRAGSPANTSGVEIHGSAVDTLLNGNSPRDLPAISSSAGVVLIALAIALPGLLMPGWAFGLACGLTPLGVLFLAHLLFRNGLVAPSACWLATAGSTMLWAAAGRSALAERRGSLFRRAVALFVGERVARQMEAQGTVEIAPHRESVTVLFTDIEGFTAYSESREPEEVMRELNSYFQRLTSIVVRHGGQVNKLIGDGMLALFGETDARDGDAELRAVQAAIEIVALQGAFPTRAGLHTGPAVVGNVGSGDKLEYTALGDTVNVASRLEALNKERHTRILMSAETANRIGDRIALLPAGEVAVRGKSSGLPVYTIQWQLE